MERVGGEVRVRTEPDRGTQFELSVQLSLASIAALWVETAGTLAILPLDAVKRTMRLAAESVARTADGDSLVFEGRVVPFVTLSRALGIPLPVPSRRSACASAIVVEAGGRMAALGVDRLLGTASVVLHRLPDLAPADAIVAGAALDAQGNPQPVLDPDGIIEAATRPSRVEAQEERAPTSILVIDDSLTTRMLEEALEAARRRSYALFLVDVEMPGMDGFTFVERVRADPVLCDTPAILVTSRAAAEDRERGARAGAQGYIVKNEFDQSDLLARIAQLVG
jgi:two-component system chemotaxis sensor kinase CheA